MGKKLAGKVAVITAATSGMALATAKLFVEEGAFVYITGRRQDALDAAVSDIGMNVRGIRADSSKPAELDRLYDIVKAEKGHIDILYASAGYAEFNVPLGQISEENIDITFDTNVKGTLFTVQKALPLLKDGASIIMTGSMASIKGIPGFTTYNASKAAVRSFARTWALELAPRGIRTNVISPGPIDTGVFAGASAEMKEAFIAQIPLGRIGQSHEIATTALFLASDDASFITGIELFVDGGTAQI